MKTINLEEIINNERCNKSLYFKEINIVQVKNICLEAIKQALELAAENVILTEEWADSGKKYQEDTITILNEYNEIDRMIYPDRQSILDTINQIE
jgi:3'-phosphoadenosine 5'-phosphosulfate sulfotransferase